MKNALQIDALLHRFALFFWGYHGGLTVIIYFYFFNPSPSNSLIKKQRLTQHVISKALWQTKSTDQINLLFTQCNIWSRETFFLLLFTEQNARLVKQFDVQKSKEKCRRQITFTIHHWAWLKSFMTVAFKAANHISACTISTWVANWTFISICT